jgi:predicted DNA-binding transcriptional regulator AlpA
MQLIGSRVVSGATTKQSAAQVPFARKAAALKAKRRKPALSAKLIAPRAPPAVRLLGKAEILQITGMTFPTIWAWMRDGKFPRSRATGGSNSKSVWLSSEIEVWIAGLPVRPLKGDEPSNQKVEEHEIA